TVGARLEGADVAEGAAVDAAHVRVQGPVERHPLDPVERAAARLLAVLDRHGRTIANRRSPARRSEVVGRQPALPDRSERPAEPAAGDDPAALLVVEVPAVVDGHEAP